ncbi:hypothetical protein EI546_08870 [Aequorivita sp. H23M31]|uniref:TonB C-terminal domain-containing protein n=1 Tax=Aequorivita ciconiae TaxID=2494375 RepID=A0A410G3H1_9FLAO|nr:energy transducer TonB [Aequorivita sp. H23M31]QAA81824.1 hypothetical protein EI546_08870 [Aequorivita sp. H23M31]
MKRFLIAIIFISFVSQNYAQSSPHIDLTRDNQFNEITKRLKLKPGSDHKIFVIFTIDEKGEITNLKARAEYPELEREAIRIIEELPRMEPAIRDGKAVSQNYSLPIIFHVETLKEEKRRLRKEARKN